MRTYSADIQYLLTWCVRQFVFQESIGFFQKRSAFVCVKFWIYGRCYTLSHKCCRKQNDSPWGLYAPGPGMSGTVKECMDWLALNFSDPHTSLWWKPRTFWKHSVESSHWAISISRFASYVLSIQDDYEPCEERSLTRSCLAHVYVHTRYRLSRGRVEPWPLGVVAKHACGHRVPHLT